MKPNTIISTLAREHKPSGYLDWQNQENESRKKEEKQRPNWDFNGAIQSRKSERKH
jgi:hypothetical protein